MPHTQRSAPVVTALLLFDSSIATNSISLQPSLDLMTCFLICGLLNYIVSVSQVVVHTMIEYLVTNGLESTKKKKTQGKLRYDRDIACRGWVKPQEARFAKNEVQPAPPMCEAEVLRS